MNFAAPARPSLPLLPLLPLLLMSLLIAGCAGAAPGTQPASGQSGVTAATEVSSTPHSTLQCTLPSNCVNSTGDGAMAPLRFSGTAAQGMAQLRSVLDSFPEASVVQASVVQTSVVQASVVPSTEVAASETMANPNVLDTIFTTPIGFKDKVTFIIDAGAGRIDFRSGSTFGLYDFGKNRSRMSELTSRFERNAAR